MLASGCARASATTSGICVVVDARLERQAHAGGDGEPLSELRSEIEPGPTRPDRPADRRIRIPLGGVPNTLEAAVGRFDMRFQRLACTVTESQISVGDDGGGDRAEVYFRLAPMAAIPTKNSVSPTHFR